MICRSDAGSPSSAVEWCAELDERLRGLAGLKPDPQRLRLERAGRRQDDVGELSRRAHEQVCMDEEVQGGQRVAPTRTVAMGHHQVRTEVDQSPGPAGGSCHRRSPDR